MKDFRLDEARAHLSHGAALVDLRPAEEFLDVHVAGSLPLVYEFGPGMSNRARDCLPLDLPLILLGTHDVDLEHAAASLRGKGFAVVGALRGGVEEWARSEGRPVSTALLDRMPDKATIVDVGDPGAPSVEGAVKIPAESIWVRAGELDPAGPVVIPCGFGIRAALAVGVLEHHGFRDVSLYREGSD